MELVQLGGTVALPFGNLDGQPIANPLKRSCLPPRQAAWEQVDGSPLEGRKRLEGRDPAALVPIRPEQSFGGPGQTKVRDLEHARLLLHHALVVGREHSVAAQQHVGGLELAMRDGLQGHVHKCVN